MSTTETQYTHTPHSTTSVVLPAGLVLTTTDGDGNTTTYHYNSAGLVTEVDLPTDTDTSAADVYYTYDSADDLLSESNPATPDTTLSSANTTYFTYDTLGRELSETEPGKCARPDSADQLDVRRDEQRDTRASLADGLFLRRGDLGDDELQL